jgi:OOP family OmpA-OmpF porin
MTLRSAVFAATLVALPFAANAQPIDGLYVGTGVGANFMQDQKVVSAFGFPGNGASLKTDVGVAALASIGWGFGNGLRAELEFNYRYNAFRGVSGKEQKYGPMVNVLYDFNGISPAFVPYIGGGVGYQAINENVSGGGGFGGGGGGAPGVGVPGGGVPGGGAPGGGGGISQTKGSFAYQGIAGVAFPLPSVDPGLAITAEYRFLGTTRNRSYNGVVLGNDNNHSLMLGIRYAFGATATTTTVETHAPVQAPARSYLVFFDWDKSNLTDRARGIIRDAAENSAKVAYTKIDVNGNADTSGSHVYNQGLSMRRAVSVAAELVKDGVPKNAIAITASGDTHLLVPTGPGVREPQNRRVEIVIR